MKLGSPVYLRILTSFGFETFGGVLIDGVAFQEQLNLTLDGASYDNRINLLLDSL